MQKICGKTQTRRKNSGQALVEYALILVLVAILFGVTLAATGPAMGNVFSSTVWSLLGQDPMTVADLSEGSGANAAFWATVEWVAQNPPAAVPVATNPPQPPTPTTDPDAPTSTPRPPTATPLPTATDGPTATPRDMGHNAPFLDTIDNPEWWRVDSSVWLGGDDWFGQYFANRELSGSPIFEKWNRELGEVHRFNIDFDWPNGTSPITDWIEDNFSIRWTRQIYVPGPDPLTVRFSTTADDGVRLWLNYSPGCAGVNSGGPATGSNTTYDSGCLLIDNWRNQGPNTQSVVRTIPPGLHMLQLDYYDATGDAEVALDISGLSNAPVLGDENLGGGEPRCTWHQADTSRSNSESFIWEEAEGSNPFPSNMKCYLELRGWIDVTGLSDPKLIFWDVWDLDSGSQVWVEVADYSARAEDRVWTRIDLRSGGSNYNWTRNVIDLPSFAGNQMAVRFGVQSGSGTTRWYVDDIEVNDFDNSTRYFTVCSGTGETVEEKKANCGSFWDLDSPAQQADFLRTAGWEITADGGQSGTGWDDSPDKNYDDNWEAPRYSDGDFDPSTSPRVHYLELNGWVDLTANLPDAEGDDGEPQLSFHYAYEIGRRAWVELQWTRDPHDTTPDNWQSIEVLVPRNDGSDQEQYTMTFREVPLSLVPNYQTQPFRMRFAMYVPQGADREDGLWIDNIYIERAGRPRFTDYPFFDDAEQGTSNWLMEGQWSRTTEPESGVFGSGHAFTDSPGGNYLHGTNASMNLRYPIDFNNDTPANIDEYFDNNPAGGNSQTTPASRPILTFWHWREMDNSDDIYLEYSKDAGATWTTLWAYYYNSRTRRQYAWERIEVDLSPIVDGTLANGDLEDDDALLRFRLDARVSGSTDDGVYIDDIRISDYTETSHRLWDPSVDTGFGAGMGTTYSDDVDSPADWWNRWYNGGGWTAVDWERRDGLRSFHESPPEGGNRTPHQTYQVLQMDRIIDLRSVQMGDNPTLYFWTRYYIGDRDSISVQVATENASYVRSSSETNYERVTGWNEWSTVWSQSAWSRVDTWVREQIPLDSYIGGRIRVRFVYDAYDGGNNRDGWYIDGISFRHRNPTPIVLPFYDPAQSMNNWIAEGTWGLAPDQWYGSGGGPASLGPGFWQGVFYDCNHLLGHNCNNANQFKEVMRTGGNRDATDNYRPYEANNPGMLQEFALEINHDLGRSGRPPGGGGDETWFDHYAAHWRRNINVIAGEYTFIGVADDGIRLRWDYPEGSGQSSPSGWNIINKWRYQGRSVYIETVGFETGDYVLDLEWFEASGDAVILLSAGKNNFSFTDSPRGGNSQAFPMVRSIKYGNSSLILNRPLRLTGATNPVLEYYTRYDLGGRGYVEVTVNGGFDWTQANLNSGPGWSCPSGANCNPQVAGWYMPGDMSDWQWRRHNLNEYVSFGFIGLRFRLNTQGWVDDGWYVTEIQVNAASILPTPLPPDPNDLDGDGVPNASDNCPDTPNPAQEDGDGDGIGDVCDNCATVANPGQADSNQDGIGDACFGTRVDDGLITAYYFNNISGLTLPASSDSTVPVTLTFVDGSPSVMATGGIDITSPTRIRGDNTIGLVNQLQSTNEITIEAWVEPANNDTSDWRRIVTMSSDTSNLNFNFGQLGDQHWFKLRHNGGSNTGNLFTADGRLTTDLQHIVMTYDSSGTLSYYVDGSLQYTGSFTPANFSGWVSGFPLTLANEPNVARPWYGKLYLVAIYNQALSEAEVQTNFTAGRPAP